MRTRLLSMLAAALACAGLFSMDTGAQKDGDAKPAGAAAGAAGTPAGEGTAAAGEGAPATGGETTPAAPAGGAAGAAAEGTGTIAPPTYGGLSVGAMQPPTAMEEAALKELAEDIAVYEENAKGFKETIKGIIKKEYNLRKKQILDEFNKQIEEEERLESEARVGAIKAFEAFLEKYPHNGEYTPDAMFRLAELYFEDDYILYKQAEDDYEVLLRAYAKTKTGEEPVPPRLDFTRTAGIYQKLIEGYPGYRNADGVYYLLGYCLNEMAGMDDKIRAEANTVWLSFVCANRYAYTPGQESYSAPGFSPAGGGAGAAEGEHAAASLPTIGAGGEKAAETLGGPVADIYAGCTPLMQKSRFFIETWLRIGEYHFDYEPSVSGIANAISAYRKALEDETSTFYDLAMYKLAWSYWRHGNYPEAIQNFIRVVEYSDKKAAETGKSGSQLRPEAIEYIALSLWEGDWNNDTKPDEVSGFLRLKDPAVIPQGAAWVPEVYVWLGDIYVDDNANFKAIEVYEAFLAKWPNAAEAPEIVTKIAKAYLREKDEQKVIETRARLASYGQDSEWWKANMDKPEVQEKARIAAEDSLKKTAYFHHENAQTLKNEAKIKTDPDEKKFYLEKANSEYNLAAQAYQKYLDLYPNTPDSYELNYWLAEAYFWSNQFGKAAPLYEAVRDSQMDNTYQKDSAYKSVKAFEQIRDEEIAKGTLAPRKEPPEPTPTGEQAKPVVSALPVPGTLAGLRKDMEAYIKLFPKDEKFTPTFRFAVAELYYNYGDWETARPLFEKMYDEYCTANEFGSSSWQRLANIAAKLEELAEAEKLAKLEMEKKCGKNAGQAGDILAKAEAKNAMATYEEADKAKDVELYAKAAAALEAAADKTPKPKDADKMLWNAVISYENSKKYASALRVSQKIIDEYPQSEFFGTALNKVAFNAFKSFDFDKSLESYKVLADEPRFKDAEFRKDAIQNVAIILESKARYKDAAPYWKKFSELAGKPAEAMEAAWMAARCFEKGKQWGPTVTEMQAFDKKFGYLKDAAEHRVEAAWYVAQAYKNIGKSVEYEKALMGVVDRFESVKASLPAGSPTAADYAGEALFTLVEKKLDPLEKFVLHPDNDKKIAEESKQLDDLRDALVKEYAGVVKIASAEWSVAAQFRIGYVIEKWVKIWVDAPVPKKVKQMGDEWVVKYQDKVAAKLKPYEEQCQKEYATAYKLSKAGGVFTKWTELTLERLNYYNPDEYPLFKKGKTMMINQSYGAASFESTAAGGE